MAEPMLYTIEQAQIIRRKLGSFIKWRDSEETVVDRLLDAGVINTEKVLDLAIEELEKRAEKKAAKSE